ncbi:MAG: DUF1579 family protein [Terriglobales bacterium]|jgi:hypothetical protein|nr:DUF1579 family protein [Terriglobales bacterium]
MRRIPATILSSILLVLISLFCAQSFAQMPSPAPELKKLDFLAGNWTDQADMKASPMGPGGKMTMTEKNEWMPGGFFLTLHSTFTGQMGSGSGIAFMGYDADAKQYTYDEFNSMGQRTHSTGSVDGDTWTWLGDQKMGDQTMKGRFTMKVLSPTSYSFKFEMSQDGTTWNTVMDGKSTKEK